MVAPAPDFDDHDAAETAKLATWDDVKEYLHPWYERSLRDPNVAPVILRVLRKGLPYDDLSE